MSFSFSFFFLKKYFSREKPLRRRYLKRWGKEGAAGAAAETVGATGGPAAAAGTAAGGAGQRLPRPGPGNSCRRLGSRSRRFSSGCSRGPDGVGRPPALEFQPRRLCVCAAPRAGTGTGVRGCPGTSTAGAGPPLPDSFLARGSRCRAPRQMLRGWWQRPEPAGDCAAGFQPRGLAERTGWGAGTFRARRAQFVPLKK